MLNKSNMPQAKVSARIERNHYQSTIQAGEHFIISDEPESIGGKDAGFNPFELVLAGLASCTNATLRMYADKKGIALAEVKMELSLESNEENNTTNIKRTIELIGDLSDAEKEKLMVIADKCLVHKMFSNPIHIETVAV